MFLLDFVLLVIETCIALMSVLIMIMIRVTSVADFDFLNFNLFATFKIVIR
jgi:hypothetical protein